ncbi:outer membrane receptor for ferrienterochelin and colicin [Pseudomonas sp. BIGb0408]|uniref:Outer membrane receptor for ferrienterochelin and colicin n=1 Tax=Phytopseudomonas flavescens TaxID=29435 RepID=A0A7Y9XR68_9GAMM|nr:MULTISPECIES: TonB-dependent receptor [Pseudomonas]MCW2294695.1 outer membrane receptor for ferrienterochelin and colicin [Pseudomonas sp. BIGb0408]NYH76031.1 outer membrane receptor for ferrienterochelin and colicin [Pseudomonas flavescens]
MKKQVHRLKHPSTGARKLGASISLGLLSLCATLPMHNAHAQENTEPASALLQRQHSFAIDAQPLADALIAFAQQSGLQVSVDPSLVGHLRGNAVRGQMSSELALSRLLDGSNVGWEYGQQVVTFHQLASQNRAFELANTVVLATPENAFQGETVIDRRAIENFAGANGDLTTLLKMHPSVRFDTTQQSSNTPGELNPADISINGAKFYQNNFMIDGVSINNDLDPGASSGSRRDINGLYNLPSNSFGIALDADLLEEVKVYDSNVSAEFGGFNGGVVDAITRRPTEDFHGKVSVGMSRSEWTNYHISGDEEAFKYSSNYANQPEFKKITKRVVLEGHVTENFGLIGNFVQKTSEIPLYAYSDGFTSEGDRRKKTQHREIDNYMLKGFWTPNERLDLTFTLVDAPQTGEYFKENQKNSNFTIEQGGYIGALQGIWKGDNATYTHKLSYNFSQTSRNSDSNVNKLWRWSDQKNWGASTTSVEGGMGNLEQQQTGAKYALKAELLPTMLFNTEHKLITGLELNYQKASYEQMQDAWTATTPRRVTLSPNNTSTCQTVSGSLDSEYCSIGTARDGTLERQYFGFLNYYRAGKIELEQTSLGLFLEDEIRIDRLTLRPGLRFDADDYMDKKTLAPRFAASYDLFGDQSTVFSAGLNRYYGRNLFKYRLADGRESLRARQTRARVTNDVIPDFDPLVSYGVDESSFRQIDIPYDDEWMVGLSQVFKDVLFELKYVNREGKNQVVRSRANYLGLEAGDNVGEISNYYVYTNAGESRSKTVTLAITPLQELTLAGTSTRMQAAFDWNQTYTSYPDYETVFSEDRLNDVDVYFDGKLIPYSDLPSGNFNRPWTARLNTITAIPALNLTVSNFFRYRGPYEQIFSGSPSNILVDGSSYANYAVGKVGGAPTWDMRVKWQTPTFKDQSLYVAADITNVTDKVNKIVSETGGSISYEVGRQYWLEVGYQF